MKYRSVEYIQGSTLNNVDSSEARHLKRFYVARAACRTRSIGYMNAELTFPSHRSSKVTMRELLSLAIIPGEIFIYPSVHTIDDCLPAQTPYSGVVWSASSLKSAIF
jgi:hypothetical protein